MLRDTFLSVLIVLANAISSHAAVTTSVTSVVTPGLLGSRTWTVTAISTDPITAIDFAGDGSNDPATGRGFFGIMNQITLPIGSTIFEDHDILIPLSVSCVNAQQDSQFKVNTSSVVIPPGLAEESSTHLQAAWAWSTPQGTSIPFAQIVTPINTGVSFRGVVTMLVNGVQTDFNVSGSLGGQDHSGPIAVVDGNLGARIPGEYLAHQFFASAGVLPITWGNLMTTTPHGGSPVHAPTLTSTGQFSWQSSPQDVPGCYRFTVSASAGGTADVGQLIVMLMPEPSAIVLFGPCGLVCGLSIRRC